MCAFHLFTSFLLLNSILDVLLRARKCFLNEPTVLHIDKEVVICGDIHGELEILRGIFKRYGLPSQTTYLFLGGLF